MAPRAIKKMSMDIGGARIGVAVMTATDEHAGLKFRTRHAADGGEVKQPRACGTCGDLLKPADIVKEYVFEDGFAVTVDADDQAYAAGPRNAVLAVDKFVPRGTLSPVGTDKSYYLIPIGDDDTAYASTAKAMHDAGVVGISNAMVGSAEHLFAIVPVGGRVLALQQLAYAEDIRQPDKLGDLSKPDRQLTRLLRRYIAKNTDKTGDLSGYADGFVERMEATLQLKRSGDERVAQAAEEALQTDLGTLRTVMERLAGDAGGKAVEAGREAG